METVIIILRLSSTDVDMLYTRVLPMWAVGTFSRTSRQSKLRVITFERHRLQRLTPCVVNSKLIVCSNDGLLPIVKAPAITVVRRPVCRLKVVPILWDPLTIAHGLSFRLLPLLTLDRYVVIVSPSDEKLLLVNPPEKPRTSFREILTPLVSLLTE